MLQLNSVRYSFIAIKFLPDVPLLIVLKHNIYILLLHSIRLHLLTDSSTYSPTNRGT